MNRCLELLDSPKSNTIEGRKLLFSNILYKPYLLLTYQQFKTLFRLQDDNLPRLNKMIIYAELDYYNYVYNQVWCYKWYPLLMKFAYNCCRRKSTSIILSFLYIGSCEYFLERFFMFQFVDEKLFDVSNYLAAPLCKKQYIQRQQELFERYREVIKKDLAEGHFGTEYQPRNWILFGNKFNIHYPHIHWSETSDKAKDQLLREFFVQNNQVALLIERVRRAGSWLANTPVAEMQEQSSAKMRQILSTIKRIVYEFPVYKQFLPVLPTDRKLDELLSYPSIDQRKRFIGLDEYKFLVSKAINLYQFYITGKNEFTRYDFKWFDPNVKAKKPTYKIENYWFDFLAFTVTCLLPAKAFRYKATRQQVQRLQQYLSQ